MPRGRPGGRLRRSKPSICSESLSAGTMRGCGEKSPDFTEWCVRDFGSGAVLGHSTLPTSRPCRRDDVARQFFGGRGRGRQAVTVCPRPEKEIRGLR